MTAIRAFLALEVPARVRDQLDRYRRSLVDELPRARWVRPEGQHLTLKFLGEVDEHVLSGLIAGIRGGVKGLGAVGIEFGGCGFFPNKHRPRVAWIGGTAVAVEPVVETVEKCAFEHGFAHERKPWSLHLTQARFDKPWPGWAVDRFLEWGRGLTVDRFECTEVVLFGSELRPGGAVYTSLERFTLL